MSGSSYTNPCPRCGGQMDCYSDHKPHDMVSGFCLECGFGYYTVASLTSLAEVNDMRVESELEPLAELAKPTAEWLASGYEPGEEGSICASI